MSEDKIKITVEVNDEPAFLCDISEETLLNMRTTDAAQRIPIARLASSTSNQNAPHDRLLLRITDSVARSVNMGCRFIAISLPKGIMQRERIRQDVAGHYYNIQDLTPKY